jgi:thiol-disulfide isomerase/thioredoxin
MNRLKKLWLVLLPVVLLLAVGCSAASGTGAPVSGNPAPVFSLRGLDGETISLSSFRGKPVLLNFWATWCGPCQGEMPFLQQVSDDPAYRARGLVLLAVNLAEAPSDVQKFVTANGITFTVLLDTNGNVGEVYNISAIPATYFIDEGGIIKDVRIGAFARKTDIDKMLLNTILKDNG